MIIRDEDVFEYHEQPRPGKLEVTTSKPCLTQRDLSLAYTPGVARPCLAIEKDPDLAYRFTGKGNLVAVVSNGTAVLGLGNIGALAGKPVMEGKGVLFKRFADIDVFDIELDTQDPGRDRPDRQGARAHLRRHQPRGHQGARVLLHRGEPQEDLQHPGLPRRPARHRHHLRRGAAERPRHRRQEDRPGARRVLRRGRRGHRLRRDVRQPRREAREPRARRHGGRRLRRAAPRR